MRFVLPAEATPNAEIGEVRRLEAVYLSLGDTNHGMVCGYASQTEPRMRRDGTGRDVCAQSGGWRISGRKVCTKAIEKGRAF